MTLRRKEKTEGSDLKEKTLKKNTPGVRSRTFCIAMASSLFVIQGCQQLSEQLPEKRENPAPTSLVVNVTSAEYVEDVVRSHASFGIVRPDKSSTLGFARGGQVIEVPVDIGNAVRKGQVVARLEQAQLQSQRDLIDRSVDSSRAALSNLEGNPNAASLQQQIGQARQRVARQANQRRDIDLELAKGILQAPYDCIISEVYVHVGDSIGGGRPVMRIIGNGTPTVELNLPATIADQLTIGQSVSIGEGKRLATVARKSAELDVASRTQQIICKLNDNSTSGWTPRGRGRGSVRGSVQQIWLLAPVFCFAARDKRSVVGIRRCRRRRAAEGRAPNVDD